MADREIDLKIVLDDNGAIQTINGVDQAIKKTQDSAESLGSTFGQSLGAAAGQVFSGIKLGAVAAAAALTGMGVAAGSALNLAREVEDLAGGFDTLSERVGNFSDEKLAKLKSATQGLTSEMDIMRAANQAVLLGVDDGSGKFEEMAAAAVKLGNAMGITTTEALNSLVLGIGRGSKMILDNLGIVVDLDTAYKNFADTNGLLASKLTESQKDLAFQAEAMKQIKEGADALPPSAETAANAYERLTTTIADSKGDFATGVSGSNDLKDALNNLDIALGSIDFSELGQKFGDFVSEMVNYASLIALNYKDMIQDAEIFKAQLLAILSFSSPTAAAETILGNASLQNQIDGMLDFTNAKEKLTELGQVASATFNDIAASSTVEIGKLEKQLVKIREELAKSGVTIDPETNAQYQQVKLSLENLKKLVPEVSNENKGLEKTFKETGKAAKEAKKPFDEIASSLQNMIVSLDEVNPYDTAVKGLFEGFKAGEIDTKILGKAFENLANDAATTELGTLNLKEAMSEYGKETEKAAKATKDIGGFSGLFEGLGEGVGQELATAITSSLASALESGDITQALQGFGSAAGSIVGTGIGTAIGGPIGGAIGQSVGGVIGDKIGEELSKLGKGGSEESIGQALGLAIAGPTGAILGGKLGALFGGMSKDEKLRRAFGDGFNQLLEAAALDTILPTEFLNTDGIQEKFDSLDIASNLIPQFDGISAALATTFGLIEDGGDTMLSQFSQILAVNFQNAQGLNDLQIILQRSGLDAETLKQNLEEAYLSGELAAGAFLNATAQVENLYAQGVPGAIGATDLAFQNFVNNALSSGAEAKDGIGDLGAEMTEALNGGVSTLAELQERLIAQGADATKVAQFFEAAAKAGISTIEQLTNVTTSQAANITASLQGVQGFFAETSNQVAELENQLNGLDGKEINIKVKYSSEYDSSTTQQAIEGGGIGPEGQGAG